MMAQVLPFVGSFMMDRWGEKTINNVGKQIMKGRENVKELLMNVS